MARIERMLVLLLLCVWGSTALAAGPTSGDGGDRIQVFYPRNECRADEIAVEVWDRVRKLWRSHPEHPFVPVESCQEERAGRLLHEIRWRCNEPDPELAWHIGLEVFDPAISESCRVTPVEGSEPRADIHVASPHRGAVVKWKREVAIVDGSVRIDGVEGVEYDLVIAIDRSGAGPRAQQRLEAQVMAARRYVASRSARLGDLRIGVVASPGRDRSAQVMTIPTANRLRIDRALQQTRRLGTSGSPAFGEGLAAALDLLAPPRSRPDRPRARRVVAIASDGTRAPFTSRDAPPSAALRIQELARRARAAGVRVHAFALAGHAEALAPSARRLAESTHGSVRRVPASALQGEFFAAVRLPIPESVTVYNPRTDDTTRARLHENGRFRAVVPMEAGDNPLRIVATTTGRGRGEREWKVRYDASAARDALLEAERERIRRVRSRKQLELKPLPGDVAAGPSESRGPGAVAD